jgi:predicted ATPase with chaperone activity
VARKIADLADDERASVRALTEALEYRAYEAQRFAER